MNSDFHKDQAEGLIKRYNSLTTDYERESQKDLLVLAQIHATLANVPEAY